MTAPLVMPFGKFKDTPINRIPSAYLSWIINNFTKKEIREAAQNEMESRGTKPVQPPDSWKRDAKLNPGAKQGGLFKAAQDGAETAPGQSGRGHVVDHDFTVERQLKMDEAEKKRFFADADF